MNLRRLGLLGAALALTALSSPAFAIERNLVADPVVQNAAYANTNCMGGFVAVPLAFTNGQAGFITDFTVKSAGGSTTGLTVYLFEANPTNSTCTDKSTFTLAAADLDKLIGAPFVLTPATSGGATATSASLTNMLRPFVAGGVPYSGVITIYYALVANGSVTPATTTDVHVKIGASLD